MQPAVKKNVRNLIVVVLLMAIAYYGRYCALTSSDYFFVAIMTLLRNTIHISIVVVWAVSIYMRVVNKRVRNMLIAVGLLMVGWLVVRTCKWEFLEKTDTLTRYLWYAFYIPMILIPLLGVFITLHIGKPDSFVIPKKYRLLYIPAVILIIVVFTNDFHRLVFDFPDGIYYSDTSYTHEILFYAVGGWFVLLGFYFVLMLLIKSRVPGSRSFQKVHIVIMGGAVVFWCLYGFDIIDADLTAVDCTLITLLLESAIQSGLIRTNTNYNKLFEVSSVAAQIADNEFNPCVVSSGAEYFSKDVMKNAVEAPQNLGEYILNGEKIHGGFVFWQDDIKDITELIETLQDTQKQLSENNYLLQAELELKEKQAKTEEKTRLFNRLIYEISPQLEKTKGLLSEAERDIEGRKERLSQLSFIGAYIKRRGNLFLISEDSRFIKAQEIEFCINESLNNLRLLDVHTSFFFDLGGEISAETAVKVYDIFQYFTEEAIEYLTAVLVKISGNDDEIFMRLMLGVNDSNVKIEADTEMLRDTLISIEHSDEDIIIDITLPKGGLTV